MKKSIPDQSLSPRLLTTVEVAELLSVSLDTVKRWRIAGEGPAPTYLTPRTVRYRRETVEAWARASEGVRS